jgi:hypothetical protein
MGNIVETIKNRTAGYSRIPLEEDLRTMETTVDGMSREITFLQNDFKTCNRNIDELIEIINQNDIKNEKRISFVEKRMEALADALNGSITDFYTGDE